MLIVADEPIPIRRLAQFLRIRSMPIIQAIVDQYKKMLLQTNSVYFLDVCQDRLKLYTRPDFLPWISRYLKSMVDPRLTPSMYEVLAIVAHRQPIIRAEIENVRGSQSGDLLRQLLEKGLIRIVGRQESLGRPVEYGLAKKGLEFFGFNRIEELLAAFNSSTPTTP
jgi:segregation and condensation protein B